MAKGCDGPGYGGQNSYGHNDAWLSPAGAYNTTAGTPYVVTLASVPRPSSTIQIVDATYYGAVPDITNQTGTLQNANATDAQFVANQDSAATPGPAPSSTGQYESYWQNIGNSKYSYDQTPVPPALTQAESDIQSRHTSLINVQFSDGHAKAMRWEQVVGNICLWATDQSGPHPNCN